MPATSLKTFVHPKRAYRLAFPAHWENRIEDDGRACGFGPSDRDDVGLWISIMPYSIDTDRLRDDLPALFQKALSQTEAANVRPDSSLRHHALKADITRADQGGHYWIIAGGDMVLFASSQVPAAERDAWNAQFERLMCSVQITRDDELLLLQVADDVLQRLRAAHPDQDYQYDENSIRGRDHRVFLDNLFRQVRSAPDQQDLIVGSFVDSIAPAAGNLMGQEAWDEVQDSILPVLKPHNYIKTEGPTKELVTSEWLAGVVICYAINNSSQAFRFVTGWDLERWNLGIETLHDKSIANLQQLPWPERLDGAREPGEGRLILINTADSFDASRLLHPDLHRVFSGTLGSPFYAGVPDRDTLVVFSDHRKLRRRIVGQLRKDFKKSAYQISPRPFLVTADGIAPGDLE